MPLTILRCNPFPLRPITRPFFDTTKSLSRLIARNAIRLNPSPTQQTSTRHIHALTHTVFSPSLSFAKGDEALHRAVSPTPADEPEHDSPEPPLFPSKLRPIGPPSQCAVPGRLDRETTFVPEAAPAKVFFFCGHGNRGRYPSLGFRFRLSCPQLVPPFSSSTRATQVPFSPEFPFLSPSPRISILPPSSLPREGPQTAIPPIIDYSERSFPFFFIFISLWESMCCVTDSNPRQGPPRCFFLQCVDPHPLND